MSTSLQQCLNDKRGILPQLELELLLCALLGQERAFLYTYPETSLTAVQLKQFHQYIERRLSHEPLAYIIQSKPFYGRDFYVDQRVLIPRPETEEFIDLVKSQGFSLETPILDIGTGSGCIAITLALAGFTSVSASDISQDALVVAQKNCQLHGLDIELRQGYLLEPWIHRITNTPIVIVANLPYIPSTQYQRDVSKKQTDLDYEPDLALFAGKDGTQFYIDLLHQISSLSAPVQACFFEIDHSHADTLCQAYQEKHQQLIWKIELDGSGKKRFLRSEVRNQS